MSLGALSSCACGQSTACHPSAGCPPRLVDRGATRQAPVRVKRPGIDAGARPAPCPRHSWLVDQAIGRTSAVLGLAPGPTVEILGLPEQEQGLARMVGFTPTTEY